MRASFKRLLSLNLALLMLLTLLPVSAMAADTVTVNLDHPNWTGWSTVSVTVGSIHIGGELAVSATELATTKSGPGWTYSAGVLTLHEDYPGLPIRAEAGLVLAVDGNVVIASDDGPALSAGGTLFFKANQTPNASLTITGAANDHAVSLPHGNHYAQYPFFLDITAQAPYDAMRIGNGRGNFFFSLNATLFANNEIATLSNTASSSDLQANRSVQPYGTTLLLTAEDDTSMWFRLSLDPMGGTIDGLEPAQTAEYEFYLPEMTPVSYTTVQFPGVTLPEVTREGHLLLGWWPAPSPLLNDFYHQFGDPVTTDTRSTTMYAIWQEMPGDSYIFVDGNGFYINNEDSNSGKPFYAIPLVDGKAIMPDQNRASLNFLGWSTTPMAEIDLSETLTVDGLYQPGEEVSLPHGTTLYAVYGSCPSVTLHGNGHTTPAGNKTTEARYYYAGETSSWNLLVYHFDLQNENIFIRNGQAALDFNADPDGYSTIMPYATDGAYVQWADAPAGSILLYSRRGATADSRYGKVILPDEAASFDLTDPNGFEWPWHIFQGWKTPSLNGNPLTRLPAPDANGLVQLECIWRPYQVSYVLDKTSFKYNSYQTQQAQDDGSLTPRTPSNTASGYIFNGWNTQADGTGDWYLPEKEVTLPGDLTLYEQTLSLASGENAILLKDPTGTKLYEKLPGTAVEGDSNLVTVTLPAAAFPNAYWMLTEQNQTYGFAAGSTVTLPKGVTLSLSDGQLGQGTFHGNGGTFAYGSTIRSLCLPSSYSNLTTYPKASDFTSTPDGATLGGWSEDAVVTELSVIYEPGMRVGDTGGVPANLYAVWDSANTVYITFNDSAANFTPYSRQSTSGAVIELPVPYRSGYQCSGWSDGNTIYPAGSSYTVPAENITLTAMWTAQNKLVVDGVEYDASLDHDHVTYDSSGNPSGWKFVEGLTLYLYNYKGGTIHAPNNLYLRLHGSNVVTGTHTDPAISCGGSLHFYENYEQDGEGNITVTGGNGMPALAAGHISFYSDACNTFTGGAGAPAARSGYFHLGGHHTVLQGGADAPAYERTSPYYEPSFPNDIRVFAGANAASATELTSGSDYTNQPYLRTEPVTHTITLVGNGGTVNGRTVWTEVFASGDNFRSEDYNVTRKNATFTGWVAQDGTEFGIRSGFTVREDRVLTAQWDVIPYDRYIILECQGVGTVDGEHTLYVDLSDGTVVLPEPVEHEGSTLEFFTWQGQNSAGNWVEVPAGKPVDASVFEPGMKLLAAYRNDTFAIAYFNLNGATPYDESPISNYRNWSSSDVEIRSWLGNRTAEGWVMDYWSTNPDGSGDTYRPGDSITIPDGVYNTMLYAQWKPVLTYTTKTANEVLPSRNADIQAYVSTPDGQRLNNLIAWRNADGTKFYTPGEACGLPAGTKLYAFCANANIRANIWLHGNGADNDAAATPSCMWADSMNEEETQYSYSIKLDQTIFTRNGYTLIGWNTKPDGSGTAYSLEDTFFCGVETQDANGHWTMVWDDATLQTLPDALYAQWEKAPSAEIIVPLDMRQQDDAVIYAAVYHADGSFAGVRTVSADEESFSFFVTEPGMTYQFFCIAADGTAQPLTTSESGSF